MLTVLSQVKFYAQCSLAYVFGGLLTRAAAKGRPSRLKKFLARPFHRRGVDDYLVMLAVAPLAFQFLRAGQQFKIFDLLKNSRGLTLPEIGRRIGLSEYHAKVLLVGLCGIQLLKNIGGRYYNDPFLEAFLVSGANHDLLPKLAEYNHYVVGPAAQFLIESMKEAKPVGLYQTFGENAGNFYAELAKDETRFHYFSEMMNAVTRLNLQKVAADRLFAEHTEILDVGGSKGVLALAIAGQHHGSRVTVIDLPEVVTKTSQVFSASEHAARLNTIGLNIFQESLPKGFDCIMLAHFTPIFSVEENRRILRKAYEALEPGACVCLYTNFVDDHGEPAPLSMMSSYFMFLAGGDGRYYSVDEYRTWLKEIGFRRFTERKLSPNESLLIAYK